MAQPPFKTDVIQIEPSSGDVILIDRGVDGSLRFQDDNATNPLRLLDLAGIRNISGIFTVGAGDGAAYATVQAAIDATPTTSSATNPSLILIGPGVYIENILIEKNGLFLIGLGAVHIRPAVNGPTVTIQAGTTTTPERTHLESLRITNQYHGKECITLIGIAGSAVAKEECSIINCDLEATGVGGFPLKAATVNNIRVAGGTWAGSSSTSLIRVNEVAQLVIRDVDTLNSVQLEYRDTDPLPCLVGSTYRIHNIGQIGDVQVELVGTGGFTLSGCPVVGDFTALGDQDSDLTGSRVEDILANGTTTVRLLGTSFDSFAGTGTVLEWDGLVFGPPSSGASTPDTLVLNVAADVDVGDVVALDPSGLAIPATSTTTSDAWRIIGVSTTATTTGNSATIYVGRSIAATKFSAAPAIASNNSDVFLDAAAGEVTLTPPTTSGNTVVRVGVLQGADGISLTPDVVFIPEIIALIP